MARDIKHIGDLASDPANARKHNPRNIGMVADALNEVGAARSIVIDAEASTQARPRGGIVRGAYPKDPALRQRRNKAPSRAILQAVPEQRRRAPSLPKIQEWHKMTVQWWREIWRSPMASEYLDADVQALFRLAIVVDAFWTKPKLGTFEAINRAQAMFGLTPLDRRRLEWIVEKAEQATKGRRRTPPPTPIDDPLRALRVV